MTSKETVFIFLFILSLIWLIFSVKNYPYIKAYSDGYQACTDADRHKMDGYADEMVVQTNYGELNVK